jgi:flagellar motor switch protein FliN/FliY
MGHEKGSVKKLQDIGVVLNVNLGNAKLTFKQICEMKPGFAFKLDKWGGEPLDVYANDVPFAKCEAVVIDDNFGIRVTEINGQEKSEAEPESNE